MDNIETEGYIFTIGYGQRQIDDLIALLRQYGIVYLLDVRSKPYSKFNPDFSKAALEGHLTQAGIKYLYMGDTLGGQPDVASCYTSNGRVDYEKVKEKEFYRRGIDRLRTAWEQGLRVALMCSEAKPELCHRTKLIGVTLDEEGIPVAHIDENGKLLTQQEALLRLTGGQLGFPGFLDPGYTSRKTYHSSGEPDEPA
jgi:uncharacterized protein (DUF488 family)